MSYAPRTTKGRWLRDQILTDLRAHPDSTHREVSDRIGSRPYETLSAFQSMLRCDELERWRLSTSGIWKWSLGPAAPGQAETAGLEALFMRSP